MLFALFTNECVSQHSSVLIFKFSGDTRVEGLIRNSNESEYREEVGRIVEWCAENSLELNVSKTRDMVVDIRKKNTQLAPPRMNDQDTEMVGSFKFLGSTVSNTLRWKDEKLLM